MVRFGGYALQHALIAGIQESRVIVDHLIPSANIGYRGDETMGGRIITIGGEIRDADYALRIEELRRRADDVARSLDLEDGSAVINAKLGTIEITWTVDRGLTQPSYQATFFETS
jgi:hypothetical protein